MRWPRAGPVGVEVSFGDATLKCKDLATFDFSKVDFCLMSAGGSRVQGVVAEDRRQGLRRHR